MFMRMLSWLPSSQEHGVWEIYIPGSTIKGAFRKRASQVLKTLWGDSPKTTERLNRLFGALAQRGLVFFSDAYLMNPTRIPERAWCSMDGVKMDPRTAEPVEEAKADYLYAYGDQLVFHLRLDLQDVDENDLEALSILIHLLQDFQIGDIPLGGQKTNGFGWVNATVAGLKWMTTSADGIGAKLFGKQNLIQEGIWKTLTLDAEAAIKALRAVAPILPEEKKIPQAPPKAEQGFISHRAFGGYCGALVVEAEVLTPISVQESGEPSFQATRDDGPINGWDFFSIAPPEAGNRGADKIYALPSKSIRGMLRHIYAIASASKAPSQSLGRLNPADSLFGWVGSGPNNAIMGRLAFGFGKFIEPQLGWFKVPYPYGAWQFTGGQWKHVAKGKVRMLHIDDTWRIFPHAPVAPIVESLADFRPDTSQASYMRAILPGGRCRFTIRFWNLEQEELQRLMWCIVLEPGLAHKMGKGRYLGFGSMRLQILPESFLTEWANRYAGKPEANWRLPINVAEWINPNVIAHYPELQQVLNAKHI
jgi:hypothetical protein